MLWTIDLVIIVIPRNRSDNDNLTVDGEFKPFTLGYCLIGFKLGIEGSVPT